MKLAQSRVTAQGQVSVPKAVRDRLGITPGSTMEWDESNGQVTVRRVGQYTSEDIRKVLFKEEARPHTTEELKEGIADYIRKRHARR